jgi:1,4-dihydroxy-2-naphthoyl-CoA hydrolase
MSEIWYQRPTAETLNDIHRNTACESFGIEIVEVGDDFIRGSMPVDERTKQPYGLLHGGASLTFAETLGSAAAVAVVNTDEFMSVGTTISANHVRAAASGWVHGTARPRHIGRTSHIWEIEIVDDLKKTVCLARLTTSVIPISSLKGAR